MKVAVIGARGTAGSRAVARLREEGIDTVLVSRALLAEAEKRIQTPAQDSNAGAYDPSVQQPAINHPIRNHHERDEERKAHQDARRRRPCVLYVLPMCRSSSGRSR